MAVIMQPTYLPWIGYFDLMDQADVFVLLDSVQFDKRSWQQRNRIKTSHGELMLTIPVIKKGKFHQRICDVKIMLEAIGLADHLRAVQLNYSKAPYFKDYFPAIESLYRQDFVNLAEGTVGIIQWIKNQLGIDTKLVRSSSLNVDNNKTGLLIDICHALNANQYLSPVRSKEYIGDGQMFTDENIALYYHQYEHPVYSQLFGEFVPYLSVFDLLFNEGPKSLEIIRSGRKESLRGNVAEVSIS